MSDLLSQEEIDALLLPVDTRTESVIASLLRAAKDFSECNGFEYKPLNGVIERTIIQDFLERSGGNVSQTARELEMPRRTLRGKIRKYDL